MGLSGDLHWCHLDGKLLGCVDLDNLFCADLVMIDHVEKKWILIDFSVPFDGNVAKKEDEKKTNYTELARSVAAEHNVRTEIIPIVVGALGVVTKDLEEYLKKLEIRDVIGGLQTAALIGTAAILKKVLST